jgi:hypothetical protein
MKLIRESIVDVFHSKDNHSRLYLEGIFLQGEILNGNRRKYPISVLDSAVSTYQKEFIDTRRSLGELNHPDHPQVNYERSCIRTISLIKDGNNYIGKALVLNVPLGQLVKSLVEDDVAIGVSSRGLASTEEQYDGTELIGSDFYICAAADVVSDPSAPDAFVDGVCERKEWVLDNGIIKESKAGLIKQIANETAKKKKPTREDYSRFAHTIMRIIR